MQEESFVIIPQFEQIFILETFCTPNNRDTNYVETQPL